jgi:hypothetical protein
VKSVTIVAPDPPPLREHPGRSAGRDSPHAEPLVHAARALISEDPESSPWLFSGMTIRFGQTMWDTDVLGYSPDSPIYDPRRHLGLRAVPSFGNHRATPVRGKR